MRSILGCAIVVGAFAVATANGATLLNNASFEDVPATGQLGQGLLPSDWLDATDILPGADTYSANNTYGLTFGSFDHFDLPFSPYDGNRWVAGGAFGSGRREGIGQLLPLNLVPGTPYKFDAAVTYTTLFRGAPAVAGGWELLLSPDTNFNNPLAESLGFLPATQLNQWQSRTVDFVAPGDASTLPFLLLVPYTAVPGALSYVGIDGPLSIQPGFVSVPEPGSLAIWTVLTFCAVTSPRRRKT